MSIPRRPQRFERFGAIAKAMAGGRPTCTDVQVGLGPVPPDAIALMTDSSF